MGLYLPVPEDIPAATITAPSFIESPFAKNVICNLELSVLCKSQSSERLYVGSINDII